MEYFAENVEYYIFSFAILYARIKATTADMPSFAFPVGNTTDFMQQEVCYEILSCLQRRIF